jgi:predicted SnoaL-like aldol condensation-catalyzing enzyme
VTATEDNKQIVLDFFKAHSRGDIDGAAAYYAERSINHGMEVTRDRIRLVLQDLSNTFADVTVNFETIVAAEEWVVLRTMQTGKHAGKNIIPINMLTPGTEPTSKTFSIQIIHMFRLAGGKITEHWAGRDDLGLHWQLGLIPAPDWYKARMP